MSAAALASLLIMQANPVACAVSRTDADVILTDIGVDVVKLRELLDPQLGRADT